MDQRYYDLLLTWCDGLVAHQLHEPPVGRGGLFCPACQIVHGRCGDAVYPLLAAFALTGREKYRHAALGVFDWSLEHATLPDGSWRNEATGWPWRGITCFSMISLGEALRLHGEALEAADRDKWRERLRRGADFLMDFMTRETGNINYPLSTAASLASAWRVLGVERYAVRARELAHLAFDYMTPEGFIWGEGNRGKDDVSGRGLRSIDLCYNAAESLPNLALYAHLTGDDEIRDLVTSSLRTHLRFLLPDGGWDGGWATRQCKWVYWGSRTSDGVAPGLMLLADHAPGFADAALRNLDQMAACTHDGLLYGGPHAYRHGLNPCIHHTFVAARGLASALNAAANMGEDPSRSKTRRLPDSGEQNFPPVAAGGSGLGSSHLESLPPSTAQPADGAHLWADIATIQVSVGDWRSSVTAYDFPYLETLQHHPSGGALTMLWHASTGPLAVASMNNYNPVEPVNMPAPRLDDDMQSLTPRVTLELDGVTYSNIYDGAAELTHSLDGDAVIVTARGHLCDEHGSPAPGNAEYALTYRYTATRFEMTARMSGQGAAQLICPIVSPATDALAPRANGVAITKPRATVLVDANSPLAVAQSRAYNHVPGVEALWFVLPLTDGEPGTITVDVQPV